ncbi:hypothetical protein N9L68_00145 [bacterium]|nr:hypothetical protein [bacterium]
MTALDYLKKKKASFMKRPCRCSNANTRGCAVGDSKGNLNNTLGAIQRG